jgi:hypothetical protein
MIEQSNSFEHPRKHLHREVPANAEPQRPICDGYLAQLFPKMLDSEEKGGSDYTVTYGYLPYLQPICIALAISRSACPAPLLTPLTRQAKLRHRM